MESHLAAAAARTADVLARRDAPVATPKTLLLVRMHGANPLLGTTFFKDAFAIAAKGSQLMSEHRPTEATKALTSGMKEYGAIEGKFDSRGRFIEGGKQHERERRQGVRKPMAITMDAETKLALQYPGCNQDTASGQKSKSAMYAQQDPATVSMQNRKEVGESTYYQRKHRKI